MNKVQIVIIILLGAGLVAVGYWFGGSDGIGDSNGQVDSPPLGTPVSSTPVSTATHPAPAADLATKCADLKTEIVGTLEAGDPERLRSLTELGRAAGMTWELVQTAPDCL